MAARRRLAAFAVCEFCRRAAPDARIRLGGAAALLLPRGARRPDAAAMRGILPPDAAMSRLDELRHVAGLIGIQTRHVDALGVWHEPSEDTLAALIEIG